MANVEKPDTDRAHGGSESRVALRLVIGSNHARDGLGSGVRLTVRFVNEGERRFDILIYVDDNRAVVRPGFEPIILWDGREKVEVTYAPAGRLPVPLRIPLLPGCGWTIPVMIPGDLLEKPGSYSIRFRYQANAEDYDHASPDGPVPDRWRRTEEVVSNVVTIRIE